MNPRAPDIHIDRVDLDVRGVPPATAEAAVRALGPALHTALAQPCEAPSSATITAAPDIAATDLTRLIAERVAAVIRHS